MKLSITMTIYNDKEKHSPHDRDDLDYLWNKKYRNLFDETSEEDYYKPIFVKSSHKGNYKYYESNRDKEKILSINQYLNKITSYLYNLINDHRISRRVWKIQINMHANLFLLKILEELAVIMYGVIM